MIRATFKVNRDAIDRAVTKLRNEGKKSHRHEASVGVHEQEGAEVKVNYAGNAGSATVAQVATYLEFGTDRMQERSWLRTWFDSNLARLKREARAAMAAEHGGDKEAVAKQAADWGAELQQWVTGNGTFAALADRTIEERERAGLDPGPPLFATGQLAGAIRAMCDGAYVEEHGGASTGIAQAISAATAPSSSTQSELPMAAFSPVPA